jgi:hypothetical protein
MHPLLEKQDDLRKEATQLLDEIVYPILKEFGTVGIGGSYVYKLLNHPDIDLDVVNPDLTKELYAQLCAKLIALKEVSRFRTSDRVNYGHTHKGDRPTGYWISPEINFGAHVWELDIWLQLPEWNTGNTNGYETKLANITDDQKITILSLKDELLTKGIYGVGKEFASVDVYDGVLNAAVQDLDGLQQYKNK